MSITQAMKVLRLPNYYYARCKMDILVAETILSSRVTESPESRASSTDTFIPTDGIANCITVTDVWVFLPSIRIRSL